MFDHEEDPTKAGYCKHCNTLQYDVFDIIEHMYSCDASWIKWDKQSKENKQEKKDA